MLWSAPVHAALSVGRLVLSLTPLHSKSGKNSLPGSLSPPALLRPRSFPSQGHGNGPDVSHTSRLIRLGGLRMRKFPLEQNWI